MISLIRLSLLAIVVLLPVPASAVQAPSFYQHLQSSNPAREVRQLSRVGWQIRGYEPLPLKAPIDWAADPHGDSNWRYQLNAMYPLAPVFLLLAEEYQPELHALAREVFDDWIAFNLTQDRDHPFRWNDMATGIRAAYLAQLIHLERMAGGEPHLSRYEEAGELHLRELMDPEKFAESNHGIFQSVGIAALCAVMERNICEQAMRFSRERYEAIFSSQFDAQGMHLEHSPEYHLLALRAFTKVERSGLLRLQPGDAATLAKAALNLPMLIHPDGGFAAVGDTEAAAAKGAAGFDPRARWLVSGGAAGQRPESGIWVFPEAGYAIFRDEDAPGGAAYLFLTAAHHSRNHKHMDTGSFEWSDRGRRILIDSGKWGYDATEERRYITGPSAHNTLETEGVSYSPGDMPEIPPEFTTFRNDRMFGLVVDMVQPRRLFDARLRRTIVGIPGEWLVVADEVTEALPSRHTAWYHLAPGASLHQASNDRYQASFQTCPGTLQILPLFATDGSSAHFGELNPRMLGWYSPSYGVLDESWQLGFRSAGRSVRMATLFSWSQSALEAPVQADESEDGLPLCWKEDGRLSGVVLRHDRDGVEAFPCE